MKCQDVGNFFREWALTAPEVKALLMLGSRARRNSQEGGHDEWSDWDFQVITDRAEVFADATWIDIVGLPRPMAYIARDGRVARVTKSTAVFPNGEIDLVLLPLHKLRMAKIFMKFGLAPHVSFVRSALSELATVLLPGYRVEKGGGSWGPFFKAVVSLIPPVRINDEMVFELAESFVVDYISVRRKLMRGEFIAAQRWLHVNLAEVNFRLLHELRLRTKLPTFADARRLEQLMDAKGLDAVCVCSLPDKRNLSFALAKCGETFQHLIFCLVGSRWKWPDL